MLRASRVLPRNTLPSTSICLVVGARVDGLVEEIDVEVVVDMLVTESTGGSARAGVFPVVVVVGDVEVAGVYVPTREDFDGVSR